MKIAPMMINIVSYMVLVFFRFLDTITLLFLYLWYKGKVYLPNKKENLEENIAPGFLVYLQIYVFSLSYTIV